MKIMPVIPTVNNNKNSRPQSKQAFGATLTSSSETILRNNFGKTFLDIIIQAIQQIASTSGKHPNIEVTPYKFLTKDGYYVKVSHPDYTVRATTVVEKGNDLEARLLAKIKAMAEGMANGLNQNEAGSII